MIRCPGEIGAKEPSLTDEREEEENRILTSNYHCGVGADTSYKELEPVNTIPPSHQRLR